MNDVQEPVSVRPALPPIWRALSAVETAAWIVAAIGVAGGLAQVTEWRVPLLALLAVAAIEFAVACYAIYLRMAKSRLERQLAETRRETAELQALAAAIRAELDAAEARRYEMLRYESQLRTEAHAREAAARQRRVESLCLELQLEQLGSIAERTELKLANIDLRLERADLWQRMAASQREAEEKLVDAYAFGFMAGKRERAYAKAAAPRHLRLVEDTA
ncbi:hypothetical protein [Streptomyces zaomyceticus]|uniref:hypothetical protein n=1 Tax=Streptomyces zaomyceticus TaxID=68286 RepID=UPI002E0E8DA1|nr:hypothetical protein OG237_20250 [Streptomyces zaomyceticus]